MSSFQYLQIRKAPFGGLRIYLLSPRYYRSRLAARALVIEIYFFPKKVPEPLHSTKPVKIKFTIKLLYQDTRKWICTYGKLGKRQFSNLFYRKLHSDPFTTGLSSPSVLVYKVLSIEIFNANEFPTGSRKNKNYLEISFFCKIVHTEIGRGDLFLARSIFSS